MELRSGLQPRQLKYSTPNLEKHLCMAWLYARGIVMLRQEIKTGARKLKAPFGPKKLFFNLELIHVRNKVQFWFCLYSNPLSSSHMHSLLFLCLFHFLILYQDLLLCWEDKKRETTPEPQPTWFVNMHVNPQTDQLERRERIMHTHLPPQHVPVCNDTANEKQQVVQKRSLWSKISWYTVALRCPLIVKKQQQPPQTTNT